MVENILKQDVAAVKEHVVSQGLETDLAELIRVEEENENREELVDWLREKRERHELLTDEERLQELRAHLEYAYRTAAISQETYSKVRQLHQELLEVN